MFRFLSILTITFFTLTLNGQPGGGGGITIHKISDSTGTPINLSPESDYHLTCFLLNDTILATTNIYSKLNFQAYYAKPFVKVYDSTLMRHTYKNIQLDHQSFILQDIYPNANYRLVLYNLQDTMVVDFLNIIGENPIGLKNEIDVLTFKPGYCQYRLKDQYQVAHRLDSNWVTTCLDEIDLSLLITDKTRSIKAYQDKRIKELEKQEHQSQKTNFQQEKKAYQKPAKTQQSPLNFNTLSDTSLMTWINNKERAMHGSNFTRRNFEGYTRKQLIKAAKKVQRDDLKHQKAEAQNEKALKRKQRKRSKQKAKRNKKYKRRLLAYKIKRLDDYSLKMFILYYDKSYTFKALDSLTTDEIYAIAKRIADGKQKAAKENK